jgi:hypothetical protein
MFPLAVASIVGGCGQVTGDRKKGPMMVWVPSIEPGRER